MRVRTLAVVTVLVAVAPTQQTAQSAASPANAPASLSYRDLLARTIDLDWLAVPPAHGERCVQWSSYDRKSDQGPGNVDAWYGNDDRGQYLRVDERDGAKEYVMAECDGPGCIARIWSANPSGQLFFDIDGARVWTVDFAQLTSGKLAPVVEPLAGVHAKGANCYLPIPFGKRLKVSASKGDFYYHVDVVRFAAGTQVPSFAPAMLQEHAQSIAAAAQRLANGQPFAQSFAVLAKPDVAPGTVRGLELRVGYAGPRRYATYSPGDDLGEVLRATTLVVRCGDEVTVRVPVLDFFAGGPSWKQHYGYLLGVRTDLTGYCHWPMPMPQGGRIELEAPADLRGVSLQLAIAHDPTPPRADALRFRADWHLVKAFPSRPFRDHLVLDASHGPGRFVGTALIVKNPHRAWWGEGDEKFTVDGEAFPSWFGTGTEDYFGYAWCDPTPFSSAYHGQTQCDGPSNYGFTAVHRMHVLDAVPFQQSFRFDLEVWHWVGGLQLDYATVAYWYGAHGATAGLPPLPDAAARTLDRLPPPKMFVVAGAIEGESLAVASCNGGRHEVQAMDFLPETFSHDAQRWWMDGKQGSVLTLKVPVAAAGRYRVTAALCEADDYGIVQLALGGHALGAPIDCYADAVRSSGPLDLGTVELPQGEAMLTLTITGSNPKAKPRHMCGLDYLRLEPVR